MTLPVFFPGKEFYEAMGNQKNKLIEIGKRRRKDERCQSSGEIAELSGLYRVQHQEHRIQKQLLVIKGTTLPFCPTCGKAIDFHLVKQVEHIDDDPDFGPAAQQERTGNSPE